MGIKLPTMSPEQYRPDESRNMTHYENVTPPDTNRVVKITLRSGYQFNAVWANGCYWTHGNKEVPIDVVVSWQEHITKGTQSIGKGSTIK